MQLGWTLHGDGRTVRDGEIVKPGERLTWPRTIGLGAQHVVAMFGENIRVMTATRIFSTAAYWVAGAIAILLSLSPKFGALLNTVPAGVLGGVTLALYGLIGLIGIRIWLDNKVDFAKPVNQFTAAVALVVGIGNLTLTSAT